MASSSDVPAADCTVIEKSKNPQSIALSAFVSEYFGNLKPLEAGHLYSRRTMFPNFLTAEHLYSRTLLQPNVLQV